MGQQLVISKDFKRDVQSIRRMCLTEMKLKDIEENEKVCNKLDAKEDLFLRKN